MRKIARIHSLSLSNMKKLFDETAEGNMERRQAIADCMGISLTQSIKESEQRIEGADNLDP